MSEAGTAAVEGSTVAVAAEDTGRTFAGPADIVLEEDTVLGQSSG